MATWCKVGKSVGVIARGKGSYQQYVTVDAMTGVFPLDQTMDTKEGASFFINPYTAVGIIDTVKQQGATTFVHTGASSQLGQMLVKLAPSQGMKIINVVRREEQADMLRKIGAEHVVVQHEGWEKKLGDVISKLGVRVAFDCVAGDTTGTIVSLMPGKSVTFVYGALSEQHVGHIDPMDLIYRQKAVKGWLLTEWVQQGGKLKTLLRLRRAATLVNAALFEGGWAASQFEDVPMEEWFEKFLSMREQRGNGGFTGRKLRILMD
jgi:NADPH:quinone reductase-like Zn-dependent oxidoreductase